MKKTNGSSRLKITITSTTPKHGLSDLAKRRPIGQSSAIKEHRPENQRDAGQRQLREHGGRQARCARDWRRARLDFLLPRVDVFLKLPGEELAHLEVEPVDIGGEGQREEQRGNCQ